MFKTAAGNIRSSEDGSVWVICIGLHYSGFWGKKRETNWDLIFRLCQGRNISWRRSVIRSVKDSVVKFSKLLLRTNCCYEHEYWELFVWLWVSNSQRGWVYFVGFCSENWHETAFLWSHRLHQIVFMLLRVSEILPETGFCGFMWMWFWQRTGFMPLMILSVYKIKPFCNWG